MEQIDKKSILEMAMGAIIERADYEMSKIIDNIMDINTKADKKRTLTLSIEITPDSERKTLQVKATAKSKLEPTNAVSTALYITNGTQGEVVAVEMVPQVPGQIALDNSVQDQPIILNFQKKA